METRVVEGERVRAEVKRDHIMKLKRRFRAKKVWMGVSWGWRGEEGWRSWCWGGRREEGGRGDVHRGSGIRSVCSESPDLGLRR